MSIKCGRSVSAYEYAVPTVKRKHHVTSEVIVITISGISFDRHGMFRFPFVIGDIPVIDDLSPNVRVSDTMDCGRCSHETELTCRYQNHSLSMGDAGAIARIAALRSERVDRHH